MSFFQTKKIHFVGIGGHGVSALARLAKQLGMQVTGSDLEESPITKELSQLGIKIFIGHNAKNIHEGVEMVIYTSAAKKEENADLQEAARRGISNYSYPQALGLISQERETIAVSGTNGKTTTTLMLGRILEAGGLDPLVIAGGNLEGEHGGGFRFGKGPFVVEACEAWGNFLHLHPSHLIITNIEEDHMDYYKDLDDIIATFWKLIGQVKSGGYLVMNRDDAGVQNLKFKIQNNSLKIKNFGIKNKTDFQAEEIKTNSNSQEFKIKNSAFQIYVPGLFNIYNALAAVSMALSLGVATEAIQKALTEFKGSWRRFQILGEYRETTIVSDYGHHPAGVKGTIEAARQKYPGHRIVTVFHPHHKWRTRFLFNQFIKAFLQSDVIILNEIWAAPGREPREDNISSADLVAELKKQGKKESYFGADLEKTREILNQIIKPGDVVLIMGAGYIYKMAEKLVKDF